MPKAGPSLRERRREGELALRRADALAAARAVFAEKGFEDARMGEIAARAEVSTASLYAIFAGKDELYREVITTTAAAVRESVRAEVERVADPRERLLAVIDSVFACWERDQALLRIYVRGTHGIPFRIREAMGEDAMRIFHEFSAWIEELARDAQGAGWLGSLDAGTVARAIVGTAVTVGTHSIDLEPERPLALAAGPVRELFERLLARRVRP
jgi:AcrR family transcriptional regulator